MTEVQPPASEPVPQPAPEPVPADEPMPEEHADAGASMRAREWLSQLEAMIQNVAREAAPVAREVGAKAAELAAVAAVKAGPAAQKAAAVTAEYGQRFAERAQSVAADLRHENEAAKAPGEPPALEGPPDTPGEPDA